MHVTDEAITILFVVSTAPILKWGTCSELGGGGGGGGLAQGRYCRDVRYGSQRS